MSLNLCMNEEIYIKSEPFDTEFDGNETFGQNTTLSGNEMDTDNIEIGVKDVKPFEIVEVENESLLAESVTDNLNSHPETRPFTCTVCGFKFKRRSDLKRHLVHRHKLDENKVASLLPPLIIKKNTVIKKKVSHTCETCHATYVKKESLNKHIQYVHQQHDPLKCAVCGACFTDEDSLISHLKIHSKNKPFICTLCGAGFTKQANLIGHLTIHSGEKPFKCSICSKNFRLKQILQSHLIKVHKQTATADFVLKNQPTIPFIIDEKTNFTVCKICNVQFSSHENLSQHECTIQDDVEIEPFEEHDTEFDRNETFRKNTTLSGNEMDTDNIEIGVKPFEFVEMDTESLLTEPVAGKSNENFSSRENLKQHLLALHDIVFKCSMCSEIFPRQSSLSAHLRTHTSIKPFTCPICSGKFGSKLELKKHLAYAHKLGASLLPPVTIHKCETCHTTFKTKETLKRHMDFFHSGLTSKPFKCNICGACFTIKTSLNTHLTIHTGEKPYRCSICRQDFRLKKSLKYHLIKGHKMVIGLVQNNVANIVDRKIHTVCEICNEQIPHENLGQHVCTIQDNAEVESFEEHDTEFNSNNTLGQNTTFSGNEMYTDNNEISVEDVKPFEIVEVETESLLAKPDNSLTCGMSNEEFSSLENLQQHVLVSHDIVFKCSMCSETFPKQSSLTSHLRIHTSIKPFTCPICSGKFSLKIELSKHLAYAHKLGDSLLPSVTKKKVHKCETCQVIFKTKEILKRHMESLHEKLRPFNCNICGGRFINKTNLKTHLLIHTGEKPYNCSICSLDFRLKGTLRRHINNVHKIVATNDLIKITEPIIIDQSKHTVCEKCNVQFSSHENLSQHVCTIQDNVKIEPFEEHDTEFDINETFGQNTTLSGNEMDTEIIAGDVNTFDDNIIKCKICSASFKKKSGLISHLRIHPEIKPFTCLICSSKFREKIYLKKHLQYTHMLDDNSVASLLPVPVVKSYNCELCNVTYKSKDSLQRHVQTIHQGVKPYKCNVCRLRFTAKSSLTRHLTIHSGEIQFKCSICSKNFRLKNCLQRHLLKVHKRANFVQNEQPTVPIIIDQKTRMVCKKCNIPFSSRKSLSQHVCTIQDNVKIESFEEIDTEFDSNETFRQNTTLSVNEMDTDNIEIGVEDVKPFQFVEVKTESLLAEPVSDNSLTCGGCNAEFSSCEKLKQHELKFHKKCIKCSICNETFARRTFKFHLSTHTESKLFKCPVCSSQFTHKSHLKKHFIDSHKLDENSVVSLSPPSNKSYICETCHLSYTTKDNLKRHIQSQHQGFKHFKCHVCEAAFTRKSNLTSHLTIHSCEKPYKCSICSEDFKLWQSIHRHLIIEHKKFKTADFIQKKEPTLPIVIGTKRFTCSVCGYEFENLYNFRRHLQETHNLDENTVASLLPPKWKHHLYVCETCHIVCKSSVALKNHVKNFHEEEFQTFECSICSQGFILKYNLKEHMSKAHCINDNSSIQSLLKPSDLKRRNVNIQDAANLTSNGPPKPQLGQSMTRNEARQPDCKSTVSSLPKMWITKVKPCCVLLDRGEVTRYLSRLDKREVTEEKGSPIEGLPPPLATPAPPVRDDPRHPCGAVSVTSDLLLGAATFTLENVRQEENCDSSSLETNYLPDNYIVNSDDGKLSANHSSKYCSESVNIESEQLEKFEEMYIKTEPIVEEGNDIVDS